MWKRSLVPVVLAAIGAILFLGSERSKADEEVVVAGTVAYPAGYRNWAHVKSMVIQPGHSLADPFEGMHHVYANNLALAGLQGGDYSPGAVIVFDLLNVSDADNAVVEGGRKFIGVMQFDPANFAATGGWGFEAFAGDSQTERVVKDGGVSCFACHQSAKETDFVFSSYRN
jgi:Cytochrome P460